MKVQIKKSKASGVVDAPPSKSIAHRALICGAFSDGSVIKNIAYSKDIDATLCCLERMGAYVERYDDYVKIGGLNPFAIPENADLYCHESGSTLRFFVPVCMLGEAINTLSGSERLFERPLTVYEEICKRDNIYFEKNSDSLKVGGSLKAGEYYVRGDISSQFITGLIFALSKLDDDSKIIVTEKFESASYVDLTLYVMGKFGVNIERKDNVFFVKGGQKYNSVEYVVEGDCSNAAFLDGFNLLGGNVCVNGIEDDTLQGDRVYLDMFKGLQNGQKSFDLSDCPDLAPVMFALSAVFGGAEFTGTARLKIKESDRAAVMAEELSKFGVMVNIYDNSVIVENCSLKAPIVELYGHNDHRIVMALSLLCSITGGIIDSAEAVTKSYPDYFDVISSLGIDVSKVI